MSDVVPLSASPDPVEILAALEECLADLDRLELGVIAAQLSPAIESLRSALSAMPDV